MSAVPAQPVRKLSVLACMDGRLRPEELLGLSTGDAHVIRNAGGLVTGDVIRSLSVSQLLGGTEAIVVIHHTDCALSKVSERKIREQFRHQTGHAPPFSFGAFANVETSVRLALEQLRSSPYLQHRDRVRGYVYDVATGTLQSVDDEARSPAAARMQARPRDTGGAGADVGRHILQTKSPRAGPG